MKKTFLIIGLIIFILGLGTAIFSYVHAQSEGERYGATSSTLSYIQPFFAPDNRLGFFDNRDGKVYIYDTSTNTCVKILQLRQLGNPLLQVR